MDASSLSKFYTIIEYPQIMTSFVMVYLLISFTSCMFKDYYKVIRIKELIMVHNVLSILFSMYMFVGILHHTYNQNYTWVGNELGDSDTTLTHYMWIFHMTKYYECMDTFIMILRKSYRQITFLHVYHHASMIVFTWAVLYNHPGGDFYLGPLLNSFVHVWMYLYYLCAGFMKKKEQSEILVVV
jgi:elongation of very long chain fatty acids protein 4